MADEIAISYWAGKAAEKVIEYINEAPPDPEIFAVIIQKCYDKYSHLQPEQPVETATVVETKPVLAPEDFKLEGG